MSVPLYSYETRQVREPVKKQIVIPAVRRNSSGIKNGMKKPFERTDSSVTNLIYPVIIRLEITFIFNKSDLWNLKEK